MSKTTPGVIELLHGKLESVKDEGWDGQKPIVEDQCKPLLRHLVGQYDAEDERTKHEAKKEAAEKARSEEMAKAKSKNLAKASALSSGTADARA